MSEITQAQTFAVAVATVIGTAALAGMVWQYVRSLLADLEEARRVRDLAKFHRDLARLADEQTKANLHADLAANREWMQIERAVGLDTSATWARIADIVAANEAARFDADEALRRWSA